MFTKGDPNINRNGRPKIVRNCLKTARELLAEKGWHPVEALWKLYQTTDSDKIKKEILVALLPYCEGKLKDQEDKQLTTPEDSKQAAEQTMEILKELEKDAHKNKE